MDMIITFSLGLSLFLLRCVIIEIIGYIYAFIILAWANILIELKSKYGDIFVTKTNIGKKILLINNGVVHSIHDAVHSIPDAYCHPESGVAEVLLNKNMVSDTAHITLIGLGGGAILYYARPQQQWQGYEIDSVMMELAIHGDMFKFVSNCPAKLQLHCADGLVAIEQLSAQEVIIIDTFFGNLNLASPIALENLIIKVNVQTILLLHISGLPTQDVLSIVAIGSKYGFLTIVKETPQRNVSLWKCHLGDFQRPFLIPSKWMLMSRNHSHISTLTAVPNTRGWV